MKKKFVAILFMLMAVCLSAVCFTACFGGGDPVAVESVTLNKTNLTLEVGEEETLTLLQTYPIYHSVVLPQQQPIASLVVNRLNFLWVG